MKNNISIKNHKHLLKSVTVLLLVILVLGSCVTISMDKIDFPETSDPVTWCNKTDEILSKLFPSRMWKFHTNNLDLSTLALDDISREANQLRINVLTRLVTDFNKLDISIVDKFLRPGVIAFGEMLRGMAAWESRGFDADNRLVFYLAWPRIFLDINLLPKADIESWVRLAPDTARWLSQIAERLREPGATLLSADVRNRAIEVCERYIATGKDNPFYKGFNEACGLSTMAEEEKTKLDALMLDIINRKIVPAYSTLYTMLCALPVSNNQKKSSDVISIDDYFASPLSMACGYMGLIEYSKVHSYLTDKIKQQWEKVLNELGIKSFENINEVVAKLKEVSPQILDPIQIANENKDKIYEIFSPFFNELPFESVTFKSSDETVAFYKNKIIFLESTMKIIYNIKFNIAHEYIPGHFLYFRKVEDMSSFNFMSHFGNESGIEGWATYAEKLAFDAGFSDNSKIGEAWYVYRLRYTNGLSGFLINTHTKDLSWDDPFFKELEYSHKTERNLLFYNGKFEGGVDKIVSYQRGALAIEWCRTRAEKALGKDFDIKNFHDYILRNQAISQTIVAGIDAWIDGQKKKNGQ